MITEVHQKGRFYRLSTGRAAQYENIKLHNPSTEYWCIPADMEEGVYLVMDPACEVNEKGTREKNDGNEVVEEGTSPPLDLDPNEVIEADEETLPYAEEDWQDPEQMEVPMNLEPDLPFRSLLRSHMRLKKNRPYNHWLKSQSGTLSLVFFYLKTVGANSFHLRHETATRYNLKATTKYPSL